MEEESKPIIASQWLVDSEASFHVTNCKQNLSDPEANNMAMDVNGAHEKLGHVGKDILC